MNGPDFAIVGVSRAATTLLYHMLSAHPAVNMVTPKEPHFFAHAGERPQYQGPYDEVAYNARVIWEQDRYTRLFEPPLERRLISGEASTSTFYLHPRSIPTITSLFPGLKIVIVLRNPIDRALSNYQYMRSRGQEPEELRPAVLKEDERVAAGWRPIYHYTRQSLYTDALQAFIRQFSLDQVHVMFHESIRTDLEQEWRRLQAFLAIPEVGLPPVRNDVNAAGEPRSLVLTRSLARLREGAAWRHIARRLPGPVRLGLKNRLTDVRAAGLDDAAAIDAIRGAVEPDAIRLLEVLKAFDSTPQWLRELAP